MQIFKDFLLHEDLNQCCHLNIFEILFKISKFIFTAFKNVGKSYLGNFFRFYELCQKISKKISYSVTCDFRAFKAKGRYQDN